MMKRRLHLHLVLGTVVGLAGGASLPAASAPPPAPIYVVVASQSPIVSVSQKDLLSLYTGRSRTLSSGVIPTPLDQQRDSDARTGFYLALTGMDIARINSYWARLHFTGQVQPPQAVGDDGAMATRLRANSSAIGYLTREPVDASMRVVLRLP